jgi:hypothetical protein
MSSPNASPQSERLVGGDYEAGALVAGGDELEEQVGGLGLERDVAHLVDLCGCRHRSTRSASPRSTTPEPSSCSASSQPPTSPGHWPFDQWGRFLPEYTAAVSLLDRLLHHAVVVTEGESFRMRQARAKGGALRTVKTRQK